MLNSLRDLSNRSNASPPDGAGSGEESVLDPVLQDGESVEYVLTSGKGIEYTTDDRTTTVEPGGGHDAYTIVTDHRVLFMVGSDADEPEPDIEFDLESITMTDARDSLLSTSLVVVSEQTDTVKFVPSNADDLEEITDYIDRIGGSWAELRQALAATREAIDAFEEKLAAGEDAHEELTQARSRLSNAHHCATRNDDGPVEAMLSLVEPVEAELDSLQVEARLDRVDELLDEARTAQGEDSFDAAVEALVEAAERLDEASDAIDEEVLEGDEATAMIQERTEALDAIGEAVVADANAARERGASAEDPEAAASALQTAFDRYDTLVAADWDRLGGVDDETLRAEREDVRGALIDALDDYAGALEAEGDDLGEGHDDAADRYEAAKEALESAQALARDHPDVGPDRFDEAVERVQEKIERSEWEWGA